MRKLLIALLAAGMLYACQDNFEDVSSDQSIASTPSAVSKSSSLRANVRNGRLYFETEDQLKGYYESLDRLIDESKGEEETVFEQAEEGYNSLRKKLDKEEVTEIFEDGSTAFAEDYILDDIRLSMLNEYAEIQVGDAVYVYFTENHIFQIPESDEASIEAFRGLEKRNGSDIPFEILNNKIKLLSSTSTLSWHYMEGGKIASDKVSDITAEYIDFYYQLVLSSNNVNCSVYEKSFTFFVQRIEVIINDNGTPGYTGDDYQVGTLPPQNIISDFTIDFMDGSTQSFSGQSGVSLTHTYNSLGTFNPVVTATFDDPAYLVFNRTESMTYGNIIVNAACTQSNQSQNPWIYNSNKAMEAKIWFKNDVFGTHAGAKTISYKRKSNGSHVKEKAYTYAEINATFRNNNCTPLADKRKVRDCNNCKDKTVRVHSLFNYKRKDVSNGDIFSEHEVRNGGVTMTLSLVLNPC